REHVQSFQQHREPLAIRNDKDPALRGAKRQSPTGYSCLNLRPFVGQRDDSLCRTRNHTFIPLIRHNLLLGPTIFHPFPPKQADISLFLLEKGKSAGRLTNSRLGLKSKPNHLQEAKLQT